MSEVIETTVDAAKTEVKAELRALADIIKPFVSFKDDATVKLDPKAKVGDKTFLESVLTEEELNVLVPIQKKMSDITLATGLAVGEVGVEHFKEHADVDVVSCTVPFGKDAIKATLQRKAEIGFGAAEKTTVYGRATMSYNKSLSTSDTKKIRANISALAAGLAPAE